MITTDLCRDGTTMHDHSFVLFFNTKTFFRLKKMNDTFEKRLELIMGPSRDIILEGVEDTDTMDRICKDILGYK